MYSEQLLRKKIIVACRHGNITLRAPSRNKKGIHWMPPISNSAFDDSLCLTMNLSDDPDFYQPLPLSDTHPLFILSYNMITILQRQEKYTPAIFFITRGAVKSLKVILHNENML